MQTHDAQFISTDDRKEIVSSAVSRLSAVCWGAVLAGAAAAAALSLILLFLGVGLGLSSVSPWAYTGVSGTSFSMATILWVTFTSLCASALGGYLAGRLRSRWIATHVDEVHFRDTAHGFLAWAVATLLTATLLTSVVSSIVGGAAQTGAALVGTGMVSAAAVANSDENNPSESATDSNKSLPYFMDKLLRTEASTSSVPSTGERVAINDRSAGESAAPKTELTSIYANALLMDKLSAEDARYAAQLISRHTNLTQQEAELRVTNVFNTLQTKIHEAKTNAQGAADEARKASAYGSLWLFVSLLMGAFVASFTAVYGGRQRDF